MIIAARILPAVAVCAVLLAACNVPPPMILPGKLDLPVASGDTIRLCPDDGVNDTTPDADCILGPAQNAFDPYDRKLTEMGWKPVNDAGQDLLGRWVSPAKPDGGRACLIVTPYGTNGGRRDGTILEFAVRDMGKDDAGASCAPV